MSDFLTEKNKKAGVLGKIKWVLCGLCILLSLGAIGASEKYIGERRLQQQRYYWDCCFCILLSGKFRKYERRNKPVKLPVGLNLMLRVRSHLKSMRRRWEKVQ